MQPRAGSPEREFENQGRKLKTKVLAEATWARCTLQITETMQSILRDFLLSFCPAKVRRPSSRLTVLRAAMWGGLTQFLLAAFVLIVQFKHFFILRLHQAAPHMDGVNSTGEAVVTVLFAIEFLFHPLSFLLLYVALEGAVRRRSRIG